MPVSEERACFIVLDVDGVLHPLNEKHLPVGADLSLLAARADAEQKPGVPATAVPGEFVPACMNAFSRAVHATGAAIVLSTTWRESEAMRLCVLQQLQQFGLPSPVGSTPRLSILRGGRAAEILAWAQEAKPARWVAIDDIDLRQPSGVSGPTVAQEHFVHVDSSTGLTEDDADRIIALLRAGTG